MSIFKKSLMTFTSNILGEPKEFKINNAIWLFMESKFGLTQKDYADQAVGNENTFGAKFVACVLWANDYETTEDEVLENTDPADITAFTMAYNEVISKKFEDVLSNIETGKSKAK